MNFSISDRPIELTKTILLKIAQDHSTSFNISDLNESEWRDFKEIWIDEIMPLNFSIDIENDFARFVIFTNIQFEEDNLIVGLNPDVLNEPYFKSFINDYVSGLF